MHLDDIGLDDMPGRMKMVKHGKRTSTYDSFSLAPTVLANPNLNIAAQATESKYNIDYLFAIFDEEFGVHTLRNIKRQHQNR